MVHFILAGAAIFAVFSAVETPRTTQDVIVLTDADVEAITEQYRQTWRAEPDAVEMTGLIEQLVREEVFYREALALGLDQGDPVIRQRLRQKLEFVVAATQEIATPTEAELQAWFEAHRELYAQRPTLRFEQILTGDAAEADKLLAELAGGADPRTLGLATQLPPSVQAEAAAVDAGFGPGFADAVAVLPVGEWAGPVVSSYGLHLVRLVAITPGTADFAAQRESIEADWLRDQTQRRMDAAYAAMRESYEIRLPGEQQE